MKLTPKLDNYKKFQLDLSLESYIELFVSYGAIKLETIENNTNSN